MANENKLKKVLKPLYFKTFGKIKKKKLKFQNFTIISNNCFGGIFYRNNNLEYLSPTCGLAFMAEEYIKFLNNMKYYLEKDIEPINIEDSKYVSFLKKIKYNSPIGKIEDVEIMFFHYDTIEQAIEKWNRRKKKINYDRIIYKFNDQNLCTYEHIKKFNEFEAENKICFTSKKYEEFDTIQLKKFEGYEYVLSDVNEKDYKKQFNMYKYINERF